MHGPPRPLKGSSQSPSRVEGGPKSVRELMAEIDARAYEKANTKYLPYYIRKRYIDDF